MMIKPEVEIRQRVNKSTLKDQISTQIKELILANRMPPGQPIVIDKLAEEFGVSHTPVREALAMLERDGLIELNSYQNPRVATVTVKDVRDVYEMRLMVEAWAAERAAENLSDEQIKQFEELLLIARKEAAVKNYEPHLRVDLMLHEAIMRSTDNKLFWAMAQRIQEHSILIRSLVEATGTTQEIERIIDEHCLIVKALFTHDPQTARKALVAHLQAGYDRTLKVLDGKNLSVTVD